MISFFASLGALPGEPLMALVFAVGIRAENGIAKGLPFFVGAALYSISGFGVWFLKVPPKLAQEQRDNDSES
jgi:hypothetical protein